MSRLRQILESKWSPLIGGVCFVFHLCFIFSYTYFTASAQGTKPMPQPPRVYAQHAPTAWHSFLDLNRWDSGYYEGVALRGYRSRSNPENPSKDIRWYPGLPLLARGVHAVMGGPIGATFTGLSVLFTLLFWLTLWARPLVETLSAKTLTIASVIILASPGSFFFFAGMTEPLIALLLLALIYCWRIKRFTGVALVLGYATATKQVFLAAVLAMFSLHLLAWRPKPAITVLQLLCAISGFLLFGLYSWYAFGNFFMSTDYMIETFKKQVELGSLINLPNYSRALASREGIVAFASMLFLLATGLRLFGSLAKLRALPERLRKTQSSDGIEIVLWWLALSYTSFCVLGNAISEPPFPPFFSFMRFQAVNVPIFLLIAIQLRPFASWKLVAVGFPLAWACLFWQQKFTAGYWAWAWIS